MPTIPPRYPTVRDLPITGPWPYLPGSDIPFRSPWPGTPVYDFNPANARVTKTGGLMPREELAGPYLKDYNVQTYGGIRTDKEDPQWDKHFDKRWSDRITQGPPYVSPKVDAVSPLIEKYMDLNNPPEGVPPIMIMETMAKAIDAKLEDLGYRPEDIAPIRERMLDRWLQGQINNEQIKETWNGEPVKDVEARDPGIMKAFLDNFDRQVVW